MVIKIFQKNVADFAVRQIKRIDALKKRRKYSDEIAKSAKFYAMPKKMQRDIDRDMQKLQKEIDDDVKAVQADARRIQQEINEEYRRIMKGE